MLRRGGFMLRRCFVSLLLSCVACSDTDSFSSVAFPPTPGPTSPSRELSARDIQLLGSYELAFDEVAALSGSGGTLPDSPRPTLGNRARLDIRGTAEARVTASLTPRWGTRFVFSMVRVDYDRLVIEEHNANSIPTYRADGETNKWEKLTFPRATDGSLLGAFAAVGFMEVTRGPDRASFSIEGKGAVQNDELAPELRIAPPAIGHGGKYLPWERMTIEIAEPVSVDAISSALRKAFPNFEFSATTSSGGPRPETTGLNGVVRSFTPSTQKVTLEPTVKDPSGNLVAPLVTDYVIHDLGDARPKHDFDGPDPVALWSATHVTDTRCEKGGCIMFPAEPQSTCAANGVAGYLTNNGALKRVKARVRVLTSDAPDAPGSPNPPYVLEPVYLRVGLPASYDGATTHGLGGELKLLRTGSEELPWESAWTTIEVDLSGTIPGDKVGFHLFRPACEYGTIPSVKDVKVSVLIDEVWAE